MINCFALFRQAGPVLIALAMLLSFDIVASKGADLYVVTIPIGLGLGRIGNFINAELYGRVTDVPWGMVRGASIKGQLVGSHVLVPMASFFKVAGIELPVFLGLYEPAPQPFQLIVLGNVKHYLDDSSSMIRQ